MSICNPLRQQYSSSATCLLLLITSQQVKWVGSKKDFFPDQIKKWFEMARMISKIALHCTVCIKMSALWCTVPTCLWTCLIILQKSSGLKIWCSSIQQMVSRETDFKLPWSIDSLVKEAQKSRKNLLFWNKSLFCLKLNQTLTQWLKHDQKCCDTHLNHTLLVSH